MKIDEDYITRILFNEEAKEIEGTNILLVKHYIDFEENEYKYYLKNKTTGETISPKVYKIEYEPTCDLFKIHDKIKINDDLTINTFFYLKSDGTILGLIYNDYSEALTGIDLQDSNLEDAYSNYKEYIKMTINDEIQKRVEKHDNNVKKFIR